MLRVRICTAEQAQALVDYIIKRRIMVAEDWDNTYGNIEVLRYDMSSDMSYVRAECDAGFETTDKDGSGIAKLALLIWKGSNLVYAEVIEGVKCAGSVDAEVHAGLALLMKCAEMGIEKLELWSDSKRVCGVLSGSETFSQRDTKCLLLSYMQTKFKELMPMFKPREVMFLPDQLLKLKGTIEMKVERALEIWADKLKGQTLFSVTHTKWASTEIKAFADTRLKEKRKGIKGYVYKHDHIFYWKAEKGEKFAALVQLKDSFSPDVLFLKIHKLEEKPTDLGKRLASIFPSVGVTRNCVTTFTEYFEREKSKKKPLLVLWVSSLYKECSKEVCAIVLVEDEVDIQLMEAAKIKPMNVSTYLYFHGVEFKEGDKVKGSNEFKKMQQRYKKN